MTAQVIFLNTLYAPSDTENKRLENLQKELQIYHAEIAYISREWNNFQKFIYKEQSHHTIRRSWKLIKVKND